MTKFAPIDLSRYAAYWGLTLEPEILWVKQGCIAFGHQQGLPIVLKIMPGASHGAGDKYPCVAALRQFAGHGAVRCIDELGDALLLEQLVPGTPLTDMVVRGADDEATHIVCDVIRKLHTANPVADLPTVEWGANFRSYLARPHPLLPPSLVERGAQLYAELSASQQVRRLLHGDLHHDNILFDQRRGWVAIDPKGVLGESEYEIGAALRNPTLDTRLYADTSRLERRIDIIASDLGLDKKRITGWCFAQAVLSSVWAVEDEDPATAISRGVAVAHATLPLLEGTTH
jgi:streptomycin 6-kinase